MAKSAMRPEVKAAKMKNNKVGILRCSVPKCEEEFFVSKENPAKRKCAAHFYNPPQKKKENSLLFKLGLIQ